MPSLCQGGPAEFCLDACGVLLTMAVQARIEHVQGDCLLQQLGCLKLVVARGAGACLVAMYSASVQHALGSCKRPSTGGCGEDKSCFLPREGQCSLMTMCQLRARHGLVQRHQAGHVVLEQGRLRQGRCNLC